MVVAVVVVVVVVMVVVGVVRGRRQVEKWKSGKVKEIGKVET